MTHEIRDVVSADMCIGCGACEVQTRGEVKVLFGIDGMFRANVTDVSDRELRLASSVCPFSDAASDENRLAAERFPELPSHDAIGRYHSLYAARVGDDEDLLKSSSGGMTSFLLAQLLQRGEVDGVIHVGRSSGQQLFSYRVSESAAEVLDSRKSAYYSTSLADAIMQVRGNGKRYAIVGIPCFIKASRLLARKDEILASQLRYFVGLVCGHMKSALFAESLAWQAGVQPNEVESVDFRVKNTDRRAVDYDYAARDNRGVDHVKATASAVDGNWGYGAFQPNACNYCDDVFAETADVALADAWLPEFVQDWRGTNVVVSRNPFITEIVNEATESQQLWSTKITIEQVADSQAGGLRHRRAGLRVRLADDLRNGTSVPAKRVKPGYEGTSLRRRLLIRYRRRLSRLSTEHFLLAKDAGDLRVYVHAMERSVRKYKLLDSLLRGRRVALRTFCKFIGGRL